MVLGGLFMLRKKKVAVYADMWGKTATGLFFASVTLTLVDLAFGGLIPKWLLIILYISAIAISVFSLFHYAYKAGFIGKKYKDRTVYEEEKNA